MSNQSISRRGVLIGGSAAVAGTAVALSPQPGIAQEPTQAGSPPEGLDGKVAVVTGAARAIGRACAVELARAGADVVAMDIANPDAFPYLPYPMASQQDLDETQRLVEMEGRRCLSIRADVRSMEQKR